LLFIVEGGKRMYHKTLSYKIFSILNYTLLAILSFICVLPLLHVLAVSFSSKAAASANIVGLWPVGFTISSYTKLISNMNFLKALGISVVRTISGSLLTLTLIFLAAYPLSKTDSDFKWRTHYSWFFVFTMLFSGGMVPSYILVQKLGLMNKLWALILPGAVNVWLLILMLNFFRTIPKSLEEAALIDGAGHLRILASIYLPISLPSVATLALFSMVGHWNSWFDGLIYISDYRNYPLATYLQTIIVQQDFTKISIRPEDLENLSQRTVKAAQIFVGALPILMVYPFLQKYFVKGVVLGAIKE
jgi:putative aldouronate transport system permease protein